MTISLQDIARCPIIEAIIDVDCDMPPDFALDQIDPSRLGSIIAEYPVLKKRWLEKHEVTVRPGEARVDDISKTLNALQFHSNEKPQIVQFRRSGFSFNRLSPYKNLDEYLPDFFKNWQLFVNIATPILVTEIRVRYVNRILLPVRGGDVDLRIYLQQHHEPSIPDLKLLGFADRYSLEDPKTGNIVNVTMASEAVLDEGRYPVIFDIEAVHPSSGEPSDDAWLKQQIVDLRELKNRVFKGGLNEECLALFCQQS